jgi:Arc/MetJ-type ribon-helix-helix transcriptional regulator
VSSSEDHLERPINEVISLLESEIERLKESLETYRLSNSPNRDEIIRRHVRTLDERQDALAELQKLLLASRNSGQQS